MFFSASFAHSAGLRESIPFQRAPDIQEGQISVPIDWDDPQALAKGDDLVIRYRVLGASHVDRPLLFFIGGGPGADSITSYFREPPERDGFLGYAKYFRVVVFDQRGTGESSPLLGDSDQLTAEIVMRYFSGKSHARDVGALVEKTGAQPGQFFIMAHSYGGLVAQQYLGNRKNGPLPKGLILASSLPGTVPPFDFLHQRIAKQIELNHQLIQPDLKELIQAARAKIIDIHHVKHDGSVLDPREIDLFFAELKNADTVNTIKDILEEFLAPATDGFYLERLLAWRKNRFVGNRLMCLISGCDVSPPFSDLTMVRMVQDQLGEKIEPWMLTEVGAFSSFEKSERFAQLNALVDQTAPGYAVRPLTEETKLALKSVMMIVLAADQDPFVPMAAALQNFETLASAPFHHFEPIEGGDHYSALSAPVADFVAQTFHELEAKRTSRCLEDLTLKKI